MLTLQRLIAAACTRNARGGASSASFTRSCRRHSTIRRRVLPRDDLPEDACWTTAQELITIFTRDGSILQIPGRTVRLPKPEPHLPHAGTARLPTYEEQGICIGASFAIGARSRDPSRRVKYVGFCQSLDVLAEAVEETVTARGGEVLVVERRLKSGVHEQLKLNVWIPYLFGVPPEQEALESAIISGGGILDRVSREWGMYQVPLDRNRC